MDKIAEYNVFPGDSYDTPPCVRRSVWEYLAFGTRLSFYLRNFLVFCRSGYLAKHTPFTGGPQTEYSLKNFRIVESCGGHIHLRGLDNISRFEGPAVIIANHMSLLETAVLHAFLRPRKDFCFVIKQSLLDVPFFGNIMRKLECVAVTRSNPREDLKIVLEEGKKRLDAGRSVVIFPQSSRSAVFDEAHFNSIGVKLAKRAGVPILPLALRTDFLENGKWCKDLGPIRRDRPVWFEFGEPIMSVQGTGKEEHRMITEFIEGRLRSWGCEVAEHQEERAAE